MKSMLWASACVLLLVIYAVFVIVYRLFIHPLSKFPGPKLAAATKWYECYFDLAKSNGGEFAWEIDHMHKKYGPVIRVNPDEIHVKDPAAYEVIYAKSPTHRDKWPPAASMSGTPLATFGTVSHDLHRKRRLAISPFFSRKFIINAEKIFKDQVEHLSRNLQSCYQSGNVLDLRVTYLAFTTDTICRLAFGGALGLQDDTRGADDWAETMEAVARLTPLIKQFPFLLSVSTAFATPSMPQKNMHYRATEFLKQVNSNDEVEEMDEKAKLFHFINESTLPSEEKSSKRLAQEGFALIAAGSETTARILTIATFHILDNPDILRRLQVELKDVLRGRTELPSLDVLRELLWLTAVVKETLRIAALITSRLPVMAPTELHVAGWTIPSNVSLE
ncbi:Cytochrome P450 monooxygenase sdnE [Lachnellula arida]|uniref:Cytochrome P450 monooxygenase sdnE n=1 Tax=Lachnellula arida TaxID=1316785 RepID=A0A8T9BFT8_9HELO|nr:Cytochrome P450 monooxygenase sdnE [Lachnellula arida]